MNHDQILHLIVSQQQEMYQALVISNWLAILGRLMDLGMLWAIYRAWLLLSKK